MPTRRSFIAFGAAASLIAASAAFAQDKSIVVASTTSTQDSGLFGHILPLFKTKAGIEVRVISQGTGQALDTGRRGDADVVFVHAKPQEQKFVVDGFGVRRYPVMYNDFVLIGPKNNAGGINGTKDIVAALQWVRTHIDRFGGDPNLVTIFGQSLRKLRPPLDGPSLKSSLAVRGREPIECSASSRTVTPSIFTSWFCVRSLT